MPFFDYLTNRKLTQGLQVRGLMAQPPSPAKFFENWIYPFLTI